MRQNGGYYKMAESMQGLKRTNRCAEVGTADIGREVTVMGWSRKEEISEVLYLLT